MPLFSDDTLQRLLENGEQALSSNVAVIFNRFSITLTANVAEYDLSSYRILGILRITHQGREVLPAEMGDFNWSNWIKPNNLSVAGIPKFYLRQNIGYDKIHFHPMPDTTIAANDAVITTVDGINATVIINAYQIADPNSTDERQRLPPYLSRIVLKYYAMSKAYLIEGKTQNIQAAQYFEKKYQFIVEQYKGIISSIPEAVMYEFGKHSDRYQTKPPRPSLPTTGKWSI